MPADRHVNGRDLLQRFLNLVFANVVETRLVRGTCCLGSVRFRDGDDRDLLSVPASRGCRGNSRPHFGYTISQAGKSHSLQI